MESSVTAAEYEVVGGGENCCDGGGEDQLPHKRGGERCVSVHRHTVERTSSRAVMVILNKNVEDRGADLVLSEVVVLPVVG